MTFDDFSVISDILHNLKQDFKQEGYQVQTIRMSTQPFYDICKTKQSLLSTIKRLDRWMNDQHIDYWNIGPIEKTAKIAWVPDILKTSSNVFCTAKICDDTTIHYSSIRETAKTIQKNADIEPQGFANLRFAALCNIPANTPFYPASYHGHPNPSFSLGFENSDLVYTAFQNASSIEKARQHLYDLLTKTYQPIEEFAEQCSTQYHISYEGIDTSISTSIHKQESIAYACEHLLKEYLFGSPGTLTIAKIITDTVQSLPLKKVGYNGLMLPVLEDHGLAIRNNEQQFNLTNLLLYSAVCGTGLDTIPLPGTISRNKLEHILMDVATLSTKLHKPLSARLMPIPGRKQGEQTQYDFSYFKNSMIMNPR